MKPQGRCYSLPITSSSAVAEYVRTHPTCILIKSIVKKCHPEYNGTWKIAVYKDSVTGQILKTASCRCSKCMLQCMQSGEQSSVQLKSDIEYKQ